MSPIGAAVPGFVVRGDVHTRCRVLEPKSKTLSATERVTTLVELTGLLDELSSTTKNELSSMPEVVQGGDNLDISKLPIVARRWVRLSDVVVVVADLKNSTQLGTGSKAASTASIYESGTGAVVQIFNKFDADFMQIQGDGGFAVFWGESRYERALCAGVTIKTNSLDFSGQIETKWPTKAETGFKVGIASGRVLVKRVGTPGDVNQQEPVWAGKPVNYAAKVAQCANRHELIVAGSVWDQIETNDYLTISCPCGDGPGSGIWGDFKIEKLPEDDPEREGRILYSGWCENHGEEYCNAILEGEKVRSEVKGLRDGMLRSQMENALRVKARRERDDRRNRLRGLRR